MTLEEALKTGNETARFCVYAFGEDDFHHSHNGFAESTKKLLDTGNWFNTPEEAEEAFLQAARENAAKEKAEKKAERKAERPAIQSPPKPAKREKAIKRAVKSKKKVKK